MLEPRSDGVSFDFSSEESPPPNVPTFAAAFGGRWGKVPVPGEATKPHWSQMLPPAGCLPFDPASATIAISGTAPTLGPAHRRRAVGARPLRPGGPPAHPRDGQDAEAGFALVPLEPVRQFLVVETPAVHRRLQQLPLVLPPQRRG